MRVMICISIFDPEVTHIHVYVVIDAYTYYSSLSSSLVGRCILYPVICIIFVKLDNQSKLDIYYF